MKKQLILLFFIALFSFSSLFGGKLEILPVPKQIQLKNTEYSLFHSREITLETELLQGKEAWLSDMKNQLNQKSNSSWQIKKSRISTSQSGIILIQPEALLKNYPIYPETLKNTEAYQIFFEKNKVILTANSPQGFYYGTLTLLQALWFHQSQVFTPNASITDWPSFKIRGISDDISRGQVPTLENFKQTLKFLSEYKMNTYLIYLEDMIKLSQYPEIGKNRGALDKKELRQIIDYAKQYYIEVIPVYQTLAHYENLLIKPEFFDIAEYPGATCLAIDSTKSKNFLKNTLTEITPFFDSPYFHMGGDESWDMGLGKSKDWVKKLSFGTALAEHYLYVYHLLKSLNKKPILYSDMLLKSPEAIKKLPKDAIIMDWQYSPKPNYYSLGVFKNKGFEFWVSPAFWNWRKAFPRYNNGISNIYHLNKEGLAAGAKGTLASSWGDDGAEGLRDFLFFGYAFAGASSWNPLQSQPEKTLPLVMSRFFDTKDPSAYKVFEILSSLSYLSDYHNLWRHPFLPLKPINDDKSESGYLSKAAFILKKVKELNENLKTLQNQSHSHLDKIIFLSFAAKQLQFFADKIKYSIQIKNSAVKSKEHKIKSIGLCEDMIYRLTQLKQEYQQLWLINNRPDNLPLILKRYDMQISYWQEKKEQLQNDENSINPVLQSRWIAHPSNPTLKKVLFQKEFEIQDVQNKTYLQLIAEGYVKAYLNGHFIGSVCAQRTLSLGVEFERVKAFEVSKYLKKGKNALFIEFQAFVPVRRPGINIYLEQLQNQQIIISERSWKTALITDEFNGAKALDASLEMLPFLAMDFFTLGKKIELDYQNKTLHWFSAVEKNAPFLVSRPYFKGERKSWIEN